MPIPNLFSLLGSFLAVFVFFPGWQEPSQNPSEALDHRIHEDLHGLVSRAKLSQPLWPASTVQFSRDGRYVLIQNSAWLCVVERESRRLRLYVDATNSYPARFSPDSQTIILISHDLFLNRWRIADAAKIENKDLLVKDGCLRAVLSPDTAYLACYTPEMALSIYSTDSLKTVFTQKPHELSRRMAYFPIPLSSESAYSGKFGYAMVESLKPMANRGILGVPMWFSPNSSYFLAGDSWHAFQVDLTTFAKKELPSVIFKRIYSVSGIQRDDRVLMMDAKKIQSPSITSLSTGEILEPVQLPGDHAYLASDTRYALYGNVESLRLHLFDLEEKKEIPLPDNLGADALGDQVVALTARGELSFYHLGESKPVLTGKLPLGNLTQLRAVAVSANLESLAFAAESSAAIFEVATGTRLAAPRRFSGANFVDPGTAFLLMPPDKDVAHEVMQWSANGISRSAWTEAKGGEMRPSASTFIEYEVLNSQMAGGYFFIGRSPVINFSLRSLDPTTGSQLWKRSFQDDSPIAFSDPQGDRLVVGWPAKSASGQQALKHFPEIHQAFKKTKFMNQDTVFEILDVHSGKTVGCVPVQLGDGPLNFDAASSAGSALFLIKDEFRLSVFSLKDGKLLLRAKGNRPAASEKAGLFVLDEGAGRLGIYDLTAGTRVDELRFSDQISYSHFSADGRSLLVLTQHQEVFVFDVAAMHKQIPAPSR